MERCPKCGAQEFDVPTVDIGVGEQQCGPGRCEACGYEEELPDMESGLGPEFDEEGAPF